MYYNNVLTMLRFSKKKVFGGCKNQIFLIGDKNAGRGDRSSETWRRNERHRDCFEFVILLFRN